VFDNFSKNVFRNRRNPTKKLFLVDFMKDVTADSSKKHIVLTRLIYMCIKYNNILIDKYNNIRTNVHDTALHMLV